ncbi:MAG: antibiotic biosynthesis monooxygenase [Candidatus Saccharibacteria bacterium]
MNYALINKMTTKHGKRDEVLKIMLESGAAFNENQNCLLYVVSKDKKEENVLWVQDVWKDEKSHQDAMVDKAMQEYVKQAMLLLKGMPEQIEIVLAGGKSDFTD